MLPVAEVAREEKAEVKGEAEADIPNEEETQVVMMLHPLNLKRCQKRTSLMA